MKILYPLPDARRTPLSLLHWWESRRLFYNRVVGAAGVFSLAGMFVFHPYREGMLGVEVAVAVVAYGVIANLCYTLGWATEVLARWVWGDDAPDMGPLLFRQGLIFSVGVTLIPLIVTILFSVLRLVLSLVT